jgi:hypothetical protein
VRDLLVLTGIRWCSLEFASPHARTLFFFAKDSFFFTFALQGCAYVATLFGPPFARTARREEEGLLYFFPLIRTLLDEKGEFPFFLLLIFVRVLLAKKKNCQGTRGLNKYRYLHFLFPAFPSLLE